MDAVRVAWRNLWRNRTRTVICLSAAGIGTAILMLVFGLFLGLSRQLVYSVTGLGTGDVQVHAPGYLSEPSLWTTIEDPQAIIAFAGQTGSRAAPRGLGGALVGLGDRSVGALVHGVDPRAEREMGRLPGHVGSGRYLDEAVPRGIVIGRLLARALKAKVGSQLVVLAQAADGSLGNDIFTVVGIMKSIGSGPDRSHAFVLRRDFDELFALDGAVHEIALLAPKKRGAQWLAGRLSERFPGAEVRTWRQLRPAVADLVAVFDASIWLPAALFLLAASLGIVNTILMATYERIPEFGMIRSLGASPWRIVRDVAAEGVLIGVAATVFGGVLGAGLCYFGAVHGFDFSSDQPFELGGMVVDPIVRVRITPAVIGFPIVSMWAVSLLAALYPAFKAARIKPVEALTHI